jgi:hypothetical protein
MPYFFIRFLENDLLPSMTAAFFSGSEDAQSLRLERIDETRAQRIVLAADHEVDAVLPLQKRPAGRIP